MFVTMAETSLEREMSRTLMREGQPWVRSFEPGDVVTQQGEPVEGLFVVLDGMLSVEVDGREVGDVGPGAVIGERAALEGGTRTATLRAVTPVRVARASAATVALGAARLTPTSPRGSGELGAARARAVVLLRGAPARSGVDVVRGPVRPGRRGLGTRRRALRPAAAAGTSRRSGGSSTTRRVAGAVDVEALGRAAEETLATERWREDLRTWAEETRPAVVAASRALVAVDLSALDDPEPGRPPRRHGGPLPAMGPEHFALMSVQATAGGALMEAAAAWGLDARSCSRPWPARPAPPHRATRSSAASPPACAAAGIERLTHLDQVQAIGGDAAAALDELLMDFGWRSLGTDLTPSLAEQPEAIVAMINGAAEATDPGPVRIGPPRRAAGPRPRG